MTYPVRWTTSGPALLLCAMPERPEDKRDTPMPTLAIVLIDALGKWSALAFDGEGGWLCALAEGKRAYLFGGPSALAKHDEAAEVRELGNAIDRAEAYAVAWVEEKERGYRTEPAVEPPKKSGIVSGPCPFCHREGGTIHCDFDGEGDGTPSLLHSLPTCATYDKMTADEFVRAVIERQHLS
jgi:hypothetical protein